MYSMNEENSIIGTPCTLIEPYRGYTEGVVIGDYGNSLLIQLTNGKEISVYRDEVILY